MSTFRRWVVSGFIVSASGWTAQDGGDASGFTFTEGSWVYNWTGSYKARKVLSALQVGDTIEVAMGGFYEVPQPDAFLTPPVASSSVTVQSVIDAGATIYTIGASVSGSAVGDFRVTAIPPAAIVDVPTLAGAEWHYTVDTDSIGHPNPDLFIATAVGNITLEVPDVTENILADVTSDGGVILMKGLASGDPTVFSEVVGVIVTFPPGGAGGDGGDNGGEGGCIV